MIKRVQLSASGVTAPTGYKPFRRNYAPTPRSQGSPASGERTMNSFSDEAGSTTGAWSNPFKPRPHILQGWKNPR